MIIGVDVSKWQPVDLPWAAWVAGGLGVAAVQMTHGEDDEPRGEEHLIAALAAGVPCVGIYHFLLHGNIEEQLAGFASWVVWNGVQFAALDIEAPALTTGDVSLFCSLWEELGIGLPLLLYGNNALAAAVAAHPWLRKFGIWWASYPAGEARISAPPAGTKPSAPASLHVVGWQFTGTGRLLPYTDAIDLSVWDELPTGETPMPQSTPTRGCLIGFHTQGDSLAVPLAAEYAAAGAPICGCLADEDGGKAIDLQAHGVRFRGTRLQFPETGDDHDFEGGGAGRLGWPEAKKLRYLAGIEYMLTVRLGIGELNAATHLQLGCNEWDGKDIDEWNATLDLLSRVVDKVNEVSARLMATRGLARPLRLLLPIFNAGTPSTSAADGAGAFALYRAISAHPIWPKMAAGNHAIGCHEGIAFDQPFLRGANTPVEPGAPMPPDGGTVNFRIDTLLWLLWQKGIQIDYAILEWYDGRHRGQDLEARIDNLIDLDRHLATMGGLWRARCLGYHTFEITSDPNSRWWDQDFTPIWQHPRWKAHYVAVAQRQNGAIDMPNVSDADYAALVAANTQVSAILDKYKPAPASLFRVRVLVPVLNIRAGPATTFADVGDATAGQMFDVYEVAASGWCRIDQTQQRWISGGAAYTVKV